MLAQAVSLVQGNASNPSPECKSDFLRDCGGTFWVLLTSLFSGHCVSQLVTVLREVKYLNFQQQKDIPGNAESLFAQNETFQKFVDNLDLIVGWYNEAGCKEETTWLLFHALSTGQAETGWGPPRGEALTNRILEGWQGWGTAGTSPAPWVPACPMAEPSCCCYHHTGLLLTPKLHIGGVGTPFLCKTSALASASQVEQGPSTTCSAHLRMRWLPR